MAQEKSKETAIKEMREELNDPLRHQRRLQKELEEMTKSRELWVGVSIILLIALGVSLSI